jgi:NAD(P)-dependent dehydrogenase (short-subunit alcohol dehydrogenase family)
MTEREWDHVNGNKPKSAFNTIRHALPLMIKQKWGRIINCTSTAWLGRDKNRLSHYAAANAGVVGFTRSIAREVFQYGITCNAYAPGALTRAVIDLVILINRQNTAGKSPTLAEQPTPEKLAPFIAYLASDAAANISGTVFLVSGGHIGRFSDPQEIASLDKKDGLWTVDELIKQVPDALLKGYRPGYQPGRGS